VQGFGHGEAQADSLGDERKLQLMSFGHDGRVERQSVFQQGALETCRLAHPCGFSTHGFDVFYNRDGVS
jgi:hypothetical protein